PAHDESAPGGKAAPAPVALGLAPPGAHRPHDPAGGSPRRYDTVVDARRGDRRQCGRRNPRRHGGHQTLVSTRALASRRPGRIERVGSARLRVVSMLVVAAILAGMVWSRLAYWQVFERGELAIQ